MSWMFSIWVATALLALCEGQNTVHEGNILSGYHLCIYNETRNVSVLVMHTVPYTVTKSCGTWPPLKTCTVTQYRMIHQTEFKTVMEQVTRCCSGYVQVGGYCALPVNRSDEYTAKPGSCPTADGLYPRSKDCVWDTDCPGWQKCCQRSGHFLCSYPANSSNYYKNGGYRFNATVTVKTDYQELMSNDRGHLNHTRLIQAMVTGALQSDVSVYYLSSHPVNPYRTATSLLIDCNFTPSLYNVTLTLYLLIKHIQEVSSVTVDDVDECAHPTLRQCSHQAYCSNTVGSYYCACRPGYIDVYPNYPGANCTADIGEATTKQSPPTCVPPMNTTSSTTVESPPQTTTCSPPSITSMWSANVTGTSFSVYWASQFQTNQTYQVVLSKRSEVIDSWVTNQTMMEMRELQPGALYNVTVTSYSCSSQGVSLHILVKTDAQTIDATARLTNIEFSDDLQNTSSQAYEILTGSVKQEIYQYLSPEMKAMVDSGLVRIEIIGFSRGSVVVNLIIISVSKDISNVSTDLLHSLKNSTKYIVDNTFTSDFDECVSSENDCSQWATCTNTWASYTCHCLDGFIDNDPERPGRACQEIASTTRAPTTISTSATTTATTMTTTAPTTASTTPSTAPTTASTTITTASTTITTAPTTASTTPSTAPTSPTTTTTIAPTTASTTPSTAPTTATTTITSAPTTASITTTTAPTTATTTTTTAPTTATTTITTAPTAAATTTTPASTAGPTTTAPTTATTTTTTAPTAAATTTTPASTAGPTTTTTAPTTATTAITTASTADPTTPSTAPTTATTTITSAPTTASITTITSPTTATTTTTTAPTTATTTITTAPTAAATTTTPASTAGPTTTTATTTTTTAPTAAATITTPASTAGPTTTTATTTTTTAPTAAATTTTPASTAGPTTTTTAPTTATTAITTASTADPTTTTTAPTPLTTTTTTAPTMATTTTSTAPITGPTTTTTAPTMATTTTTTTTTATTTTTTIPITATTTPSAPTTISTTSTTATTATTVPPTAPVTTPAITTTIAPTTTTTVPATTIPAPTTIITSPTTTLTTLATSATTPTTTTTTPTSAPTPTIMTSSPTTTSTIPTTTISASTTTPTALITATDAISVECRLDALTVSVAMDFLLSNRIREGTLYLGLQECGINGGNATHVQLTVAWKECSTLLVHNLTYYTASVTLFNTMDMYTSVSGTVEGPKIRLEVPIICTYKKSRLFSADFGSMGYDTIQDVISGLGSFQVTVQLMNGTMPLPHNYSLSSQEPVVVEVSLNTSSEQIKVVINKCWATPTQNSADTESYTFLENSCAVSTYTTVLMNGNSSTSRVSVKIFAIVDLDVIYLHCQVQICVEIESETCVPDCLQRTAWSLNTIARASGSAGPLLRSDEDSLEEGYTILHIVGLSFLGIGLSLFFIVGFICLFYYQRNRIGHYNFSTKPKQENFTYLVFNT